MEMGTRDSSPLARTGRRREWRRRLPDAIEGGLERRHVAQTSDDWKEEQAGADDRSKLPIGADADPLLDQPGPFERHHQRDEGERQDEGQVGDGDESASIRSCQGTLTPRMVGPAARRARAGPTRGRGRR